MDRVEKQPDGSYHWSCSIDKEYHMKSVRAGYFGVAAIIVFVLLLGTVITFSGKDKDFSLILIPVGVVLITAVPLLVFSGNAKDPHQRYDMNEEYVKSGYGQAALFSYFKQARDVTVAGNYIEFAGKFRNNRIYIPREDMEFVKEFILSRIPEDAVIHYM